MAPSAKNHKQHRIKLVEIHHMECLNQLLPQRRAQRRRGQQRDREQSQEQDPGCFYLTVKLGWDLLQPRMVGALKPQLLVVFIAIL